MRHRPTFIIAVALLILTTITAQAQVYLKPVGGTVAPLRLKAIDADVSIDGQFALTVLHLTFYNETGDRQEAEFIYTLPEGATATYFAYWAGEEKVVARVVEKEKAAAIYSYITSRQRDPALIEMIDKRTFRARVFPIFPGDDLRIEVRMAHALPSDGGDVVYTLPLEMPKEEKLESVDVSVTVKQAPDITQVMNNYGLQAEQTTNTYNLILKGTNFNPPKDLVIRQKRNPKPLQVSSYTARAGGPDGFFALALTPDHSLTDAKISINGVSTYQVVQPLKSVKAGQVLVVTGRYKGSGKAYVVLAGNSPVGRLKYAANVEFEDRQETANTAGWLWAADRLEQLGKSEVNRREVIALSMRFGMPSKFTSWLAVPKAEMELYKREQDRIEASLKADQLAILTADGKRSSAEAREVRSKLNALCKKLGWDAQYELKQSLYSLHYSSADEVARLISEGKGNSRAADILRNRVNRTAEYAYTYRKPNETIKDSVLTLAYDLGYKLASEKYSDLPNAERISALNSQLVNLKAAYGDPARNKAESGRKDSLRNKVYQLAENLVHTRMSGNKEKEKEVQLERKIAELEKLTGPISKEYIERNSSYIAWKYHWNLINQIDSVRWKLIKELNNPQTDPANLKQLKDEFVELNRRYKGAEYAQDRLTRLEAQVRLEKVNKELGLTETADDQDALVKLAAEKKALESKIKELRARMGDPLISVDAPADAQQVIAVLPDGEIKVLEYNTQAKRWEARFDIPFYAREGSYTIKILVVLHDGTRKTLTMNYTVDTTPPSGKAVASVKGEPQHKVRLTLDADDDTARVVALLPWGDRVEMVRSTTDPGQFWTLVSVPETQREPAEVTFVLTDKAHNRMSVQIDCAVSE